MACARTGLPPRMGRQHATPCVALCIPGVLASLAGVRSENRGPPEWCRVLGSPRVTVPARGDSMASKVCNPGTRGSATSGRMIAWTSVTVLLLGIAFPAAANADTPAPVPPPSAVPSRLLSSAPLAGVLLVTPVEPSPTRDRARPGPMPSGRTIRVVTVEGTSVELTGAALVGARRSTPPLPPRSGPACRPRPRGSRTRHPPSIR